MANYPTSDPSFTTKNTGDVIQNTHLNSLQDEVVAIGAALRGTLSHGLTVGSTYSLNVTSGNSTLGGALSVAGNTTLAGAMNAGASTLASLSVSGNSTVVALTAGNTTLANLSVTGGSTLGSITFTGDQTFTSTVALRGAVRFGIASTTLSGGSTTFNNVVVPSSATLLEINSNSTAITVTGFSGGSHGRMLYVSNVGAVAVLITLANDAAGSSADCRMAFHGGTAAAIGLGGSLMLMKSTNTGVGSTAGFWYGLARD